MIENTQLYQVIDINNSRDYDYAFKATLWRVT